MTKGWYGERYKHSLASKGIKSDYLLSSVRNKEHWILEQLKNNFGEPVGDRRNLFVVGDIVMSKDHPVGLRSYTWSEMANLDVDYIILNELEQNPLTGAERVLVAPVSMIEYHGGGDVKVILKRAIKVNPKYLKLEVPYENVKDRIMLGTASEIRERKIGEAIV